jgi:hypothetical protein
MILIADKLFLPAEYDLHYMEDFILLSDMFFVNYLQALAAI